MKLQWLVQLHIEAEINLNNCPSLPGQLSLKLAPGNFLRSKCGGIKFTTSPTGCQRTYENMGPATYTQYASWHGK